MIQIDWGDALVAVIALGAALGLTIVVACVTGGHAVWMIAALTVLWGLSLGLLVWCIQRRPRWR